MRTVEFRGEEYRIAEKVGLAPLIRLGKMAKTGGDSLDMAALAVMYDVLEQCFSEEPYCAACGSTDKELLLATDKTDQCCEARQVVASEFDRFMDFSTEQHLDHEEILEVVGKVMEVLSDRSHTGPPSASPAGPRSTPQSFEDVSSLRAQRRLEEAGRADLAVAVLQRREHLQLTRQAG